MTAPTLPPNHAAVVERMLAMTRASASHYEGLVDRAVGERRPAHEWDVACRDDAAAQAAALAFALPLVQAAHPAPAPNGAWPDAERPGVPLNPERDGWHWLATNESESIATWDATMGWLNEVDIGTTRYHGPVPTPDQARAREAEVAREAAEAMRERCVAWHRARKEEKVALAGAMDAEGMGGFQHEAEADANWHHDSAVALAALALPTPGADRWEPIETAPAWEPDLMIVVVGGRYTKPERVPADGGWLRHAVAEGISGCPTHWMPDPLDHLPAPPAAARAALASPAGPEGVEHG